jgi:hypothetical protein
MNFFGSLIQSSMDEHTLIVAALKALDISFTSMGGDTVDDFQVRPESLNQSIDREAVRGKVEELRPLKALEALRTERNDVLENTDRYALPDFPHPSEDARQAWLDYRQALRDLPANSPDATIDPESGALIGVDWPDEPEH